MQKDIEILSNKETHPHIVVATPGRLNALVRDKKLRLSNVKVFVLDECDKMLDQIGKLILTFMREASTEILPQICDVMSRIYSVPLQPRSRL